MSDEIKRYDFDVAYDKSGDVFAVPIQSANGKYVPYDCAIAAREEVETLQGCMAIIAMSIQSAMEKQEDAPFSAGNHLAEAHCIAAKHAKQKPQLRYLMWMEFAAMERERCAKIAESMDHTDCACGYAIAAAIREAGTK